MRLCALSVLTHDVILFQALSESKLDLARMNTYLYSRDICVRGCRLSMTSSNLNQFETFDLTEDKESTESVAGVFRNISRRVSIEAKEDVAVTLDTEVAAASSQRYFEVSDKACRYFLLSRFIPGIEIFVRMLFPTLLFKCLYQKLCSLCSSRTQRRGCRFAGQSPF